MEEFKLDEEEHKRNTEAYLQCLVQDMRKEKNPTAGRYRAFIFEFAERADQLVDRGLINLHTWVFFFLQAFSDKIGDKLCKRCKIDIEDPTTTTRKWNNLRKEALKVSTKDHSQMSRVWKVKQIDDSGSHPVKLERPIERPTTRAPDRIERKKPKDLDSVTHLMKDLRLSQAEAQKKLEEYLVFIRDVFTKLVSSIPRTPLQPGTYAPYYSPNQYGNKEYPPSA